MKARTCKLLRISELIVNICLLPLFRARMFRKVELVPVETESGEVLCTVVSRLRLSEVLKYDPLLLIYIGLALTVYSILISVLSFIIKHEAIRKSAHVFAICSVGFFLFLVFLAFLFLGI